jgi:carboxymethylenebutenolidase
MSLGQMRRRLGATSPGRWIALLATLLVPPAIGCAPRTPAPSVGGNESGRPTVSQTSAATASDSVSWLQVRTDSGVILAAVARPSGLGPFPTLIILHGTHGFAEEYVQLARDLARHGVIGVAACWFGGHYGAGTRYITPLECPGAPPFVDVPGLERFRLARQSLTALVEAVRTRPDVQRERVAIFGHSRGGGAALDFVLQHRGTVKAAILNSAGYPAEVAARASEVDVPILLLHGTADSPAGGGSPMTNVAMARAFEAALRNAGKPVEAVYYDGSGHEAIFTSRSQYADAVQRIAAFLHDLR